MAAKRLVGLLEFRGYEGIGVALVIPATGCSHGLYSESRYKAPRKILTVDRDLIRTLPSDVGVLSLLVSGVQFG